MLELVNEVLDMSKLESDEVILEEIPFQLGSIFEELLVVIEQIAAKRNIRIVPSHLFFSSPAIRMSSPTCCTL